MSKIALSPSPTGSAVYTIASPAGSTDRTLTLPDGSGALYNQSNILGTVSQSGGVPTGAIIESGSNANGEFVKYADGTMICMSFVTSSASATVQITYPVAFIATPFLWASAVNGANLRSGQVGGTINETETGFSVFNVNGARVVQATYILAIGRWF